jgi:hypothetical protein
VGDTAVDGGKARDGGFREVFDIGRRNAETDAVPPGENEIGRKSADEARDGWNK